MLGPSSATRTSKRRDHQTALRGESDTPQSANIDVSISNSTFWYYHCFQHKYVFGVFNSVRAQKSWSLQSVLPNFHCYFLGSNFGIIFYLISLSDINFWFYIFTKTTMNIKFRVILSRFGILQIKYKLKYVKIFGLVKFRRQSSLKGLIFNH